MSQIIKAFTGVFIVLFLMATGMGILGSFLQTLQAQNLHGQVIDELENSDYAVEVLEDAFEITAKYGLELELLLYLRNGDVLRCAKAEDVSDVTEAVEMAEVSVTYPIQIPFIGMDKNHRLVGYAR